jgi:2-haloacid dehalogenase
MDPWPDAVSGLLRLKRRFIITPLSNGSMRQLVGIARHAVLPWDLVLSVELFHAYKPDPRIYRGAIELLQLQPAEVLMVAAHTYDLRAARAEGMQTAFVGRPQEWGPDGSAEAYEPGEFDLVVRDFEDLATQLNC